MTDPDKRIACFGEIVLRMSVPHGEMPLQSPRLDLFVGGAEANVAAGLSALDNRVAMIGAVPAGALGDGALDRMRAHGVDTRLIARPPGRMGLYYHLPGGAMRPDEVVYDRADSAFARMRPDDWDWDGLLTGIDWLHVSGVTPALGEQCAAATLDAVRTARAAGIGISFDGNWRGRLWERWNPDPAATLRPIVDEATVLFGNHRDASLLLGREFSGEGADRRREAALAMLDAFPTLETIASTARHIVDSAKHELTARVDTRDDHAQTATAIICPVVDRIGTGDAFAVGVLDALFAHRPLAAVAESGLAAAAIAHGVRGDFTPLSRALMHNATHTASDVAR